MCNQLAKLAPLSAATILLVLSLGCGAEDGPTEETDAGVSEAPDTAEASDTAAAEDAEEVEEPLPPYDGDDVPWQDKTFDQKRLHMTIQVFPTVVKMMAAYEDLAGATCEACHGPGAAERNYKMPFFEPIPDEMLDNPFAPFVEGGVIPKMAEMLNMELRDPIWAEEGPGFGCYSCHKTHGAE